MKDLECQKRKDPVARMISDITALEVVEWLIEFHGLDKSSAETVERNLREQFKWHRLQGRLDRGGFAVVMAELLQMRRSPMTLERPPKESVKKVAAGKNLTREQLATLVNRIALSALNWNQGMEDGDRGPGNNPVCIVIYDDGSGLVANGIRGNSDDVMNIQMRFGDAEEAADYLVEHYDALDVDER